MEEVLVLQKRIVQIQNDKTQAQTQLNDANNKLDTIQKQLSTVNLSVIMQYGVSTFLLLMMGGTTAAFDSVNYFIYSA